VRDVGKTARHELSARGLDAENLHEDALRGTIQKYFVITYFWGARGMVAEVKHPIHFWQVNKTK
jgi:hypothetical protein